MFEPLPHQHPYTRLPEPNHNGAMLLTPCPGTRNVSALESLQQLQHAGAVAVVTMMPMEELHKNNQASLPELCSNRGLRWFHLPIEDDHAPEEDFEAAWDIHKGHLIGHLKAGDTIALHCKGGTGRTGLVAALILQELGCSTAEATQAVQTVKPKSLQIPSQVSYLTKVRSVKQ